MREKKENEKREGKERGKKGKEEGTRPVLSSEGGSSTDFVPKGLVREPPKIAIFWGAGTQKISDFRIDCKSKIRTIYNL